ncbi:DUF2808 domain-containing protein [Calothrix sp. PCC 6303]|uniref:DUF2808 domain-containing protein n=1 Tax=Calothrix sp. PCC 6303 TaxID=1170562 RepID=UPI0002A04936|nr:DUF2808 domain-containing protein [Calothrix sp. PCC 6303]AFZ01140.1 hypothetical protein Cal6303_2116 [Calothrix sp. PCC 6303]
MNPIWKHLPIITTLFAVSFSTIDITRSFASLTNENKEVNSESQNQNYLSLVSVRASEITARARNTKYYFTINIPKSSRPLRKVNIVQRGGFDIVKFNLNQTKAYAINNTRKEIKITETKPELNGQSVTFDPPVESGQKLTLVMGVRENPQNDGNYLFEVTVFPEGKLEMGQSLGIGRLRITSMF